MHSLSCGVFQSVLLCLAQESFAPPRGWETSEGFCLFSGRFFVSRLYIQTYDLLALLFFKLWWLSGAINIKVTPWFFARLDPT